MDKVTQKLIQLALQTGASDAAIIAPQDIGIEDGLARMCREPLCRQYGKSLSCPPYVAGPDYLRERLKHFEYGIAVKIDVSCKALLGDDRMRIMRQLHLIVAKVEQAAIVNGYTGSTAFAGGSCKELFCADDSECRVLAAHDVCPHTRHCRPSMSGFGIDVSGLMVSARWPMNWITSGNGSLVEDMTLVCGLVLVG